MKRERFYEMITKEMQKQVRACREEIDRSNKVILDKYQCDLEVRITITPNGNIPNIAVVPRSPRQGE